MANQNNVNVFSAESRHKTPVTKHQRKKGRIYTPEEFLALPMVQEIIKDGPAQYRVDEETGDIWLAPNLAELYCSVCNQKKFKKALRKHVAAIQESKA
ncbi:hypothetical protein [Pantoea dispersa]|uniref:hypothetical protein n=1 Tax=Pantoea dispersa TaxID=59814 RepID=UPI000FDA41DE|nr:hypothetical protein [Pantoea dispersa]MDR6298240.1 hypothetical protein [Pantoea dispersa]RVU75179.1 hypothetical protein EKH82_11870 [Pantoea dispersa]